MLASRLRNPRRVVERIVQVRTAIHEGAHAVAHPQHETAQRPVAAQAEFAAAIGGKILHAAQQPRQIDRRPRLLRC